MQHKVEIFQAAMQPYFIDRARDLPWRHLPDNDQQRFYEVLVSEMMLQQTRAQRVVDKYTSWLSVFPDMPSLAAATFTEVLAQWTGLGYSRRAKYLHDISKELLSSNLPVTVQDLICFKGIGSNTAASIIVYTYNYTEIFIETNVRTVLFYHFFQGATLVSDAQLHDVMSLLVPTRGAREWYWALMDYGTELKKQVKNISQSKHYRKQSSFEGSDRQLRARLLKYLLDGPLEIDEAKELVNNKPYIIDALIQEKMTMSSGGQLYLPN